MAVTAKLNYLRIAPRKVRMVADSVRGQSVEQAQNILAFTQKKGAGPLLKLLNQAVANARNNFQLDPSNFYIFKITVDEGPKYKRWRARARGQAGEIQKKTSRITLILEAEGKTRKAKRKEGKKPEKELKLKEAEEKEKPKIRPEKEMPKPKGRMESGKAMFRRKAF
jgi:large subunit ribosomal protein L22